MKRFLFVLALCVALAVCAAAAFADDLNPPPWQRYTPGTTYADWEFSTDSQTAVPDAVYNPYGTEVADVQPGLFQSWWSSWEADRVYGLYRERLT